MRKLTFLISLLVSVALLSALAEAKKDKRERVTQLLSESQAGVPPLVSGTVTRFIINPHGEVDGLLFADGTLARFPAHMAPELTAALKPGDAASVRGFREYGNNVKALIVTNEATKRAVIEHPPAPGYEKMPKHLRFASLTRLQASGKIERPLYDKKGEINGVMLDDGTVVRFAKQAASRYAAQLQVGQSLAVEGIGAQNDYGRALEATAIGATAQTLQPIYGPR